MTGLPRARKRDSVFLTACVTGRAGAQPARYVVRNLSPTGACVTAPDELQTGAQLTVTIGRLIGVTAEVIWVRDGQAGLKFQQPIDVAEARSRPPQSLDPRAGWGRASLP